MHENLKLPIYPYRTDAATLRTVSQEVDPEDPETLMLAKRMDGLLQGRFVGMSAIQLGEAKQVIVVRPGNLVKDLESQFYLMANPKLLWASSQTDSQLETCLSILAPDADMSEEFPARLKVRVIRALQVRVRFYDLLAREWREIETGNAYPSSYTARVIQHEMDHLGGMLITDYLPDSRQATA